MPFIVKHIPYDDHDTFQENVFPFFVFFIVVDPHMLVSICALNIFYNARGNPPRLTLHQILLITIFEQSICLTFWIKTISGRSYTIVVMIRPIARKHFKKGSYSQPLTPSNYGIGNETGMIRAF